MDRSLSDLAIVLVLLLFTLVWIFALRWAEKSVRSHMESSSPRPIGAQRL